MRSVRAARAGDERTETTQGRSVDESDLNCQEEERTEQEQRAWEGGVREKQRGKSMAAGGSFKCRYPRRFQVSC